MGSLSHLRDVPHFVYLCFDADGELLYIGCTSNPTKRQGHHRTQSAWWPKMASCRLIGPFVGANARARAMRFESIAIQCTKPPFNRHPGDAMRARWEIRRAKQRRRHEAGEVCGEARCRVCGGYSRRAQGLA